MIIEIPRHCSRHALSLNLRSTHVRQIDEDPLPTDEETMAQRDKLNRWDIEVQRG